MASQEFRELWLFAPFKAAHIGMVAGRKTSGAVAVAEQPKQRPIGRAYDAHSAGLVSLTSWNGYQLNSSNCRFAHITS